MHSELTQYLEWMLGKWHQNGLHSITREDMAELERVYLNERARGDETAFVVEEFVDAMNTPAELGGSDRRLAALALLRKHRDDLQTMKENANKKIRV